VENRVMAEIAGLATSRHDYRDVVHGLLDLVEQVVSSPYLGLAIQEQERMGHYLRAPHDVDPEWARELGEQVAHHHAVGPTLAHLSWQHGPRHVPALDSWFVTFPAETRSGRCGSLTLGTLAPLTLEDEDAHLMQRLACQVVLVLDHALLLNRIDHLEVTDDLTGVTNARRLFEILEYEMRRHTFFGRPLALLLLDVEGLHAINRSYGHRYGNHVLQKLAHMLRGSVRPVDMVARCGLDEFAVVMPEADEEEARDLAERLGEQFLDVEFAGGRVGITVGVAHVIPGESLSAEQFVQRGEEAMYAEKRRHRAWAGLR
jgi:diguanylate cyclase (GGDEF)-like protein